MNDCVFITIPVPQSHHRDIHSPPPAGVRRLHPGSRSGEFGGWNLLSHPSLATTVVSELHTQRDVVLRSVKAPQASSALHFGVCESRCQLMCIWGDGAGKSSVNLNTSMHRRRRSLGGGERHVRRKEMLRDTAAFIKDKKNSESAVLCLNVPALPWCSVPVKSRDRQAVPPTCFSYFSNWTLLYSSSHSRTLKLTIIPYCYSLTHMFTSYHYSELEIKFLQQRPIDTEPLRSISMDLFVYQTSESSLTWQRWHVKLV